MSVTEQASMAPRLVGMLDSPYVRRVAISLELLGIPFEHEAVSVFTTFARFHAINPVVKAPTLVCADGTVLMESTLILDYAEALADPGLSLVPTTLDERRRALRVLGLALAGTEKAVQYIYERNLRPPEKQHGPWLDRVERQAVAAFSALEIEAGRMELVPAGGPMQQAGITSAVVFRFAQEMIPELVPAHEHPHLAEASARAEETPAFLAYPPAGPGVVGV